MPCVVLIDEYDDPAARALANPAEAELDEYFGEHMAAHAKVMGLADDAYRAELKRDGTADEALAQIREKGYAAPYLADGRRSASPSTRRPASSSTRRKRTSCKAVLEGRISKF